MMIVRVILALFVTLTIFQCEGYSLLPTQKIQRSSSFIRYNPNLKYENVVSQSRISPFALKMQENAVVSKEEKKGLTLNKGTLSILGGFLSHLALGTIYCWGNFISYSPLNLRFFDGTVKSGIPPDALYVLPITFLAQTIVMPFAQNVFKAIGASKSLLLGSWIAAASVYLASYQTTLLNFILTYSVLFGVGLGIGYAAPMYAGWKWLPKNKGLVSGGVLAGFGGGGFLFSLIGSKIVNPTGINPVGGQFPAEVYNRFPAMLRTLSVFYAVLGLLGSLLVSEPEAEASSATSSAAPAQTVTGVTVKEALSSWQFWWMELMVILSATAGLNTVVIYKQFAATAAVLAGDRFQALVGGIGALFNGSGRLFWGNLSDKIGFKKSFTILTILQLVLMLTYQFSRISKPAFAVNTCLLFFCLAGNLALIPPAVQRMFGFKAGTIIYGIIYSAFAIASILGGMLTKSLVKSFGYETVFKIMAGMSILATAMVSILKPLKNYDESTV
mmetsp:Transcript_10380/g.11205  ORF Transcript_10380/g.11205 Transcript_10380/m.11205 type:complete len:500 (+) Transcript_10380:127-1626(+)